MSIIPDELKTQTFPCPTCKKIISSDHRTCRFCGLEINDELQSNLVRGELTERSLARLRNHKIYMGVGAAVFLGGLLLLAVLFIESRIGSRTVNFDCWTPLLIIGGLGAAIMGLKGYLREKQYLKNV